ncbi:Peptidyl-prolyl cis-trans isomerase D [Burkholderiales bacterium]|nr:Peptidyl-prolyl cis-trans isomerase D [Burkholderiales bacterium]
MYDFLAKHKRIVQVLLTLAVLPFLFFGVDRYGGGGDEPPLATVGGDPITRQEFDQALRDQGDRMRQSLGRGYDPALLDNPEVRYAVVENLVNQRLLVGEATRERFRVSDVQLAQFIAGIEAFHVDGKFSPERYRDVLQAQNMVPAGFEERLRRDLALAPLQEPLASGSLVARSSALRYLSLLEQRREVAAALIDAESFARDAKVDDDAVKAFYDQNPNAFMTPEQAKIEIATLSIDAIAEKSAVDAAAVRKQYDDHLATYTTPEERSAAHILIAARADASDADKAAAKKKAGDVAARVRAAPARFAEIARAESQDPGSAGQGGDLGSFQRGSMVKPFEDAVFAAQAGDIVGPVETDFGWHVIRVTGARAATQRPFDEVRAQIEADLRRAAAQEAFQSAADQFQNLVYEQADSLQGVGKALGIAVQTTDFVTRTQAQQLAGNSAKFAEALFSPESVQGKRNTDAIEVAPSTLVAGRIVEYRPAAPQPYDAVKAEIRRQLERQAAADAAARVGREKLALLEQGKSDREAGLAFGKPVELSRNQPAAGVPPDALAKIFQVTPSSLPSYVTGVTPRGGFAIFRVIRVIEPEAIDEARLKLAGDRLGDQLGREFVSAYLASLRARSDVTIDQALLEKQEGEVRTTSTPPAKRPSGGRRMMP